MHWLRPVHSPNSQPTSQPASHLSSNPAIQESHEPQAPHRKTRRIFLYPFWLAAGVWFACYRHFNDVPRGAFAAIVRAPWDGRLEYCTIPGKEPGWCKAFQGIPLANAIVAKLSGWLPFVKKNKIKTKLCHIYRYVYIVIYLYVCTYIYSCKCKCLAQWFAIEMIFHSFHFVWVFFYNANDLPIGRLARRLITGNRSQQ